jgi:nucleotide-binding universal stress UspA family protein
VCLCAKEVDADLIIIATHGYTGLDRALLGSVTERVARHAPCPVLIVRTKEHDFVDPS